MRSKKFRFAVLCMAAALIFGISASAVELSDVSGHWAENEIGIMIENGWMSGYPDGSFRPDRTITRAEFTVTMINTLGISTEGLETSFSDVSGHWARQTISTAEGLGIVVEEGELFRPDDAITRQEMAQMLYRLASAAGVDLTPAEQGYTDGAEIDQKAHEAVLALRGAGIMDGKPGNLFDPGGSATRAEAVAVMVRLLRTAG